MKRKDVIGYSVLLLVVLGLSACMDPIQRRDQYYESGVQYLEEDRAQEAIIQFRNALQIDATHVPTKLKLAEAFTKAGDATSAIREYRQVLTREPENTTAKIALSKFMLSQGVQQLLESLPEQANTSFDGAREMAEEVLSADPDNLDARIALGNALAGLRDFDTAAAEFRRALESDASNIDASTTLGRIEILRSGTEEAEKVFLETVEKNPGSKKAKRALAQFYLGTQQPDKAIATLEEVLEQDPSDEVSLVLLMVHYVETREFEKVPPLFETGIANSDDPGTLELLFGRFQVLAGKPDDAIRRLTDLADDPKVGKPARYTLVQVYLSQDRTDEATSVVDSLLSENREDVSAIVLKGRIEESEGRHQEALAQFQKAIDLKPSGRADLYMAQAQAHMNLLQLAEARASVEKALELDAGNVGAAAARAKIIALQRRREEMPLAISIADAVLATQPDNVDALTARGEAHFRQRQWTAAKADFEKAVSLTEDSPFFAHRLGVIEAAQGNIDSAARYFRQALAINPNLQDVMTDLAGMYLRANQPDRALEEVRRIPSTKEEIPATIEGQIQLASGDLDAAEASLRRAISANKEHYPAYLLLGELKLRKGDLQQALSEVDQLLAVNSKFAPAYLLKAYYLDAGGRKDEAVRNYRLTIQYAARDSEGRWIAANNLAWILADQKQELEEAVSLAREARRARPQNIDFADTLGWVYFQQGNYTLAADQFLFAVNESSQPRAEHYYRLGLAYYMNEDFAHAKETLARALQISDSFDGAADAKQKLSEMS